MKHNPIHIGRVCLVHYHEIGLKGRNRASFEKRLIMNLQSILRELDVTVEKISGRILVSIGESQDYDEVVALLVKVPGIVRVSCGWRVPRDMGTINKYALMCLDECEPYQSFKVKARRSNTDFPVHSQDINIQTGAYLVDHTEGKTVRMNEPDAVVNIEVIQNCAYVYAYSVIAVGGLPVGTAGKVVCMVSSGIDSPVSMARIFKRGAVVVGVHFSGRPITADTSEYLVDDIARQLNVAEGIGRIYVVPFGSYQKQMAGMVPQEMRIIFYRRLMLAVAERIAQREGALAIVTGESLGQVASQTLENIRAVDDVCELPVLRPLIGTDKQEIIAEAKRLGTFDISIRPAEDCCTLFMPRSPETRANLGLVRKVWAELPIEEWMDEIMANLEWHDYRCPAYKAPKTREMADAE